MLNGTIYKRENKKGSSKFRVKKSAVSLEQIRELSILEKAEIVVTSRHKKNTSIFTQHFVHFKFRYIILEDFESKFKSRTGRGGAFMTQWAIGPPPGPCEGF